jgi:hypothetical protein
MIILTLTFYQNITLMIRALERQVQFLFEKRS